MSLQEIVKKEYIENDNTLCFKTTSIAKVVILSFVTFGIYNIILSINYWKSLKENFGYKVSPFWRGLFNDITNFSLFPILDKYFKNFNIQVINPYILASIYVVFDMLRYVLGKLPENVILDFICLILIIPLNVIFIYIQSNINKLNRIYYPDAPKNPWKISNTIWTIVFIVAVVLACLPE